MPNRKSALKDLRKNQKRHQRNKSVKSEIKTLDKKFDALVKDNKLDEAKKLQKKLASKFNKAASKKIVHRNTAKRKISRMMKKLSGKKS